MSPDRVNRCGRDYSGRFDARGRPKRLPGRWFDWLRRHGRGPADPRAAKSVEAVLAGFPSWFRRPTCSAG